jgi:hypothetical protein
MESISAIILPLEFDHLDLSYPRRIRIVSLSKGIPIPKIFLLSREIFFKSLQLLLFADLPVLLSALQNMSLGLILIYKSKNIIIV